MSLAPQDGMSPRMKALFVKDAGKLIAAASCGDSAAAVRLPKLFDACGEFPDGVRQLSLAVCLPRGLLAVIRLLPLQNDRPDMRGLLHPLPESARRQASLAALSSAVYVSWRFAGDTNHLNTDSPNLSPCFVSIPLNQHQSPCETEPQHPETQSCHRLPAALTFETASQPAGRTPALMSDIGDAVANAMRSRWGSLAADLCALSPRGSTSMCTCHMLQSRGPCVASNDLDPLGSALLDNAVARALGTSDHDSYRLSTQSGSSSESGPGGTESAQDEAVLLTDPGVISTMDSSSTGWVETAQGEAALVTGPGVTSTAGLRRTGRVETAQDEAPLLPPRGSWRDAWQNSRRRASSQQDPLWLSFACWQCEERFMLAWNSGQAKVDTLSLLIIACVWFLAGTLKWSRSSLFFIPTSCAVVLAAIMPHVTPIWYAKNRELVAVAVPILLRIAGARECSHMADVAGGNQEQLEQGAIACTFVIMFMHLIEGFGLRVLFRYGLPISIVKLAAFFPTMLAGYSLGCFGHTQLWCSATCACLCAVAGIVIPLFVTRRWEQEERTIISTHSPSWHCA